MTVDQRVVAEQRSLGVLDNLGLHAPRRHALGCCTALALLGLLSLPGLSPAARAQAAADEAAAADAAATAAAAAATREGLAGAALDAATKAAKKAADAATKARAKATAAAAAIPTETERLGPEVATLVGQFAAVAEEARRLGRYRALLRGWRLVHVPASILLLALVAVHVYGVCYY
jgi:hypothetical protein